MDKKNLMRVCVGTALTTCGLACAGFAAAPLKTVPWNGHVGAVSFTFDDALQNQVENLKPILDEMPDVQVTFFLTSMSYYFNSDAGAQGFAGLAKAGHEMGNHSLTHGHFTGKSIGDASLKEEIVDHAAIIEEALAKKGASVKVSSFATPYCANDDAITDAINQRHFINRDCSDWGYRKAWDKEPEWFKFPALIWTRGGKSVKDITVALDTCVGNADFSGLNSWETPPGPEGEWMVVLNHGVADDADDYAISPADIKAIIQHARDNKMWVAGFGTVGAYYRAHFTLDVATAVADGNSYKVSWEKPHPHMPKSIPMKVKLNDEFQADAFGNTAVRSDGTVPSIVLEQNGKVIWPDANGVYTIEFTELSLNIRMETAEDSEGKPASSSSSSEEVSGSSGVDAISQQMPKADLKARFLSDKNATYTLFDMNGNQLGLTSGFKVPESMPKGVYIIRGESPDLPPLTMKIKR